MLTLWRELVKIVRQVKGSQNIFHYKSTVASQLYLLYCFSGNIYFTDKIHNQVKYLWCCVIACQLLFAYTIAVEYLWYGPINDPVMIFNVVGAVNSIHLVTLGVPLYTHVFGDRIEAMIEHVDNISTIGVKQEKIIANAKKYFGWFFTIFWAFFILCISVGTVDVAFFFEEEKAANYLYYAYPPPWIQKYSDNFGSFMVLQCLTTVMFLILMVESWMVLGVVLYWAVICFTELTSIREYLSDSAGDLNKILFRDQGIAYWNPWNNTFERNLEHSVKEFQNTTCLINYLKSFVEIIGTMVIISAFGYGVPLLYICASSDLSLVLKVKCATCYMDTGIAVFMFYWIGQTLNNLTSEVSMAVYFTPWYWSVNIRQKVYVLLCQTQTVKNFAVFRVYDLLLNNFSRYLHGLVSCTNMLLKLTDRK